MKRNPFLPAQDRLLLSGTPFFTILVYDSGRLIIGKWRYFCLSAIVYDAIPFLLGTILIYMRCQLSWIANYCTCAKNKKSNNLQFIAAHFDGLSVSLVACMFFPTTMVWSEAKGSTAFDLPVKEIYRLDRADNLLPSLRCFVSYLHRICCSISEKTISGYCCDKERIVLI